MHYIFESILVGMYSISFYYLFSLFIINKYFLFFFTGFFKHLMGYFLYIHNYYCNFGYACKQLRRDNKIFHTNNYPISNLVFESIIEGLLYLIIGLILLKIFNSNSFKSNIIYIFFTGIILHITSEWFNIHYYFCKNRCI
jgi:hypothetical protein